LGTSIPTALLPGIGASMRIDVAASASAMSSASEAMREILIPRSGLSS